MSQKLSGEQFQIGFAMAGAISAGAYTAGVLDFFIRALEAWEKARGDDALADAIPNHRVGIKVMTGASAGAITGALGVIAMAQGVAVTARQTSTGRQVGCTLPSLYDAWVVKPCMVSSTGGNDLLSGGDLAGDASAAGVKSLLNSALLDDISDGVLRVTGQGTNPLLPYVSSSLHVYMTLTNLRGVPYEVKFVGGNFGMMDHGDRVHYRVADLGGWISPSAFGDADQVRDISVKALFASGGPSPAWTAYAHEAVASGAFPVGLAPRTVTASLEEYAGRAWPMLEWHLGSNFTPSWPEWFCGNPPNPHRSFEFLSVDGGTINNDPFEYARFALMDTPPDPNPRDGEDADRAVIMIAPFPEPPDFLPDGEPEPQLVSAVKALLPAMVNQARFKPTEMVLAADEAVFSRYLIGPHRTVKDALGHETEERYAIACGLLGGFGGFLSQRFREHDFILGQRNCQKFLASSFALPAYNPRVFHWSDAARANPRFVAADDGQGQTASGPPYHCIVPLIGEAAQEIELAPWPRLKQAEFDELVRRIGGRLDQVAPIALKSAGPAGLLGLALPVLLKQGQSQLLDFVKGFILSDLVRRDQIEGWDMPVVWKPALLAGVNNDDVRAVVAELLDPSYDLRNEGGIAAAAKIDIGKVRPILAACQAATGKPYEVWRYPDNDKAGNPLFCLTSRKPSWLRNLPGVRQLGRMARPPRVDKPGL